MRNRRNPWIENIVYQLFQPAILEALETDGLIGHFKLRIESNQKHRRGRPPVTNPFQIALSAIFAHDLSAMLPRDRERIGTRPFYAYHHYVPIAFLAGFLRQSSPKGIGPRSRRRAIDEAFEHWVVKQRALERLLGIENKFRGSYSKSTKSLIKKLLKFPKYVEVEDLREILL